MRFLDPTYVATKRRVDIRWRPFSPALLALIATVKLVFFDEQLVYAILILLAAVALLVAPYFLVRLTADERGLRIVNVRSELLPWSQIREIKHVDRQRGMKVAEITLRDGSKRWPTVTKTGGNNSYTSADIAKVISRLEQMRKARTAHNPDTSRARN